jgi:PIN domain nuclease of toxin-antitoxin system
VKLLLDTHVWIWSQEAPEKLGNEARRLLIDGKSTNYLATISVLELARLVAAGNILINKPLAVWIETAVDELHAEEVAMTREIAAEAYALPGEFHRDPADRILVATARREGLTLLTADDRILSCPHVRTLDARR